MVTGRPPKYETPEQMQEMVDAYFHLVRLNRTEDQPMDELMENLIEKQTHLKDIEDTVPSISGLSYALGMSTEALRNYEGKEEFLVTVKRAKQRVEMSLEQRLAGNAVTGAIFNLKNNYGWKDKTEVETKHSFADEFLEAVKPTTGPPGERDN